MQTLSCYLLLKQIFLEDAKARARGTVRYERVFGIMGEYESLFPDLALDMLLPHRHHLLWCSEISMIWRAL